MARDPAATRSCRSLFATKESFPRTVSRRPPLIEAFDLVGESGGNHIALDLPVGRQQAVFNAERFGQYVERANSFVVWQRGVDRIHRRLDARVARAIPRSVRARNCHESGQKTARVAD